MELLSIPEYQPFIFSFVLVVLIGMVELLSLLAGAGLSGLLDHAAGFDVDGDVPDTFLGWLHVGKVPLLILLVILLSAFALSGVAVNGLSRGLLDSYPPVYVSSAIALGMALPLTRLAGGLAARMLPGDESSAVTLESLAGLQAVLTTGTAEAGRPAEAKVSLSGRTYYVFVEPGPEAIRINPGVRLLPGRKVVLLRHISGSRFYADETLDIQ